MFKFLKKKLKGALGRFSKKVEDSPDEEVKVEKELAVEPPRLGKELVEKKVKPLPVEEEVEKVEEISGKPELKVEEKKLVVEKAREKVEKLVEEKAEKPELKVEEEIKPVEKIEKPAEEVKPVKVEPQKRGLFGKIKGRLVKRSEPVPESEKPGVIERPVEERVEKPSEKRPVEHLAPVEEKRGFFSKLGQTIKTKRISEKQFNELFWDLELALLESSVAVDVIEKLKSDLRAGLVDKPIPRGRVEEVILSSLHSSLDSLFSVPSFDLLQKVREKKPFVICFIGINGSGKTTSIAKVASLLKGQGLSVVLAAADTFRAAAIDQLQVHADNLGVKLIRSDYGADPAAVAFDAVKHAEASGKDVVLIDTAGRLHSNVNLMEELKKIIRVAKPDLKIFVGESITGNDCVEQARQFRDAVGIDGIILAKADIDEKGGAAISVSYVTAKPILYLGVGQDYGDLEVFDRERLIARMGL